MMHNTVTNIVTSNNGTAHFNKHKQLLEHQNYFLLRDIWWSKLLFIFKMLLIFSIPVFIRHLWQLKTIAFLHRCLICTVLVENLQGMSTHRLAVNRKVFF